MSDRVPTSPDVRQAIEATRRNGKRNIAAAARLLGVAESTLYHRLHGRKTLWQRGGNNSKLSKQEEEAISQFCIRLHSAGLPVRSSYIASYANDVLAARPKKSIKVSAKGKDHDNAHAYAQVAPKVSRHWALRFFRRHPELTLTQEQPVDAARAFAKDVDNLSVWFGQYRNHLDKHGIADNDVWNFDEIRFRLGGGSSGTFIAESAAHVPSRRRGCTSFARPSNPAYCTVVETISAAGSTIPPFVIFARHEAQSTIDKVSCDPNTIVERSDTGDVDDDLAVQWIKHFAKHVRHGRKTRNIALVMNGVAPHCTKRFLDICNENNIYPVAMIPYSSHLVQPLDQTCLQIYRQEYAQVLGDRALVGPVQYSETSFMLHLATIRRKALSASNIASSWQAAGLYPFNPSVVLQRATSEAQQADNVIPTIEKTTTGEEAPTSLIAAPKTAQDRRRNRDFLNAKLSKYKERLSPSTWDCLEQCLSRLELDAMERDLMARYLQRMQAQSHDSETATTIGPLEPQPRRSELTEDPPSMETPAQNPAVIRVPLERKSRVAKADDNVVAQSQSNPTPELPTLGHDKGRASHARNDPISTAQVQEQRPRRKYTTRGHVKKARPLK